MSLDATLKGWTGPSSETEQEKQERTCRMVREAIDAHPAFKDCSLTVYAKGSYANNTNVRTDSDVDIAVQCHEVRYWAEAKAGTHTGTPYQGIWTPAKLRAEVGAALRAKFPSQVNDSGSTAFTVRSSSARVEADVVPCFDYRYYFSSGGYRDGARVVTKEGKHFDNYPAQQLENGKNKNTRTKTYYKQAVRVLKRTENAMLSAKVHREVPSFFVECLVYNCPDSILLLSTWTDTVRGILVHVWNDLQGDEPESESQRWLEVNECKYLFHSNQKWTRADGCDFAKAAWNYLGYTS
jgi:hypothetical protein